MANAILIPGKEKRVYGGHPWVFRSDIARVEGDFTPGDIVSVYSSKGKFLAKAFTIREPDFPAHHEPGTTS